MTEEQAFALTNPDGGVYAPGAFVLALGALKAEPRITEAFRTGGGLGWHEQDAEVFTGWSSSSGPATSPTSSRPGLRRSTACRTSWAGRRGCGRHGLGLGASTILLAQGRPNSQFTGSDYHAGSIEMARKRAGDAGVADRGQLRGLLGRDVLRHRVRPGRRRVWSVLALRILHGDLSSAQDR